MESFSRRVASNLISLLIFFLLLLSYHPFPNLL
nr:MAG TPA: hypothetical protein [Caudoviricetes sp.]